MHNGAIMPTDVRCLVKSEEPYALVELVGVLDLPAAEPLRGTLLTCLADRCEAVVVDVSNLRVDEPEAVSIFTSVAREAAEWPAGQLLIYVPTGDPTGVWDRAEVAVSRSLPEAFAQLGDPVETNPLSVDLEPVPGAARRARELVTDGCARWDLPDVAGSACIAITEMVNNVVAHARTRMMVRLAVRDLALHIAVRDFSRQPARFAGLVLPSSTGGRGLLLLDTVARRWGATPLDDGKVVWAVLYAEDEVLG